MKSRLHAVVSPRWAALAQVLESSICILAIDAGSLVFAKIALPMGLGCTCWESTVNKHHAAVYAASSPIQPNRKPTLFPPDKSYLAPRAPVHEPQGSATDLKVVNPGRGWRNAHGVDAGTGCQLTTFQENASLQKAAGGMHP